MQQILWNQVYYRKIFLFLYTTKLTKQQRLTFFFPILFLFFSLSWSQSRSRFEYSRTNAHLRTYSLEEPWHRVYQVDIFVMYSAVCALAAIMFYVIQKVFWLPNHCPELMKVKESKHPRNINRKCCRRYGFAWILFWWV